MVVRVQDRVPVDNGGRPLAHSFGHQGPARPPSSNGSSKRGPPICSVGNRYCRHACIVVWSCPAPSRSIYDPSMASCRQSVRRCGLDWAVSLCQGRAHLCCFSLGHAPIMGSALAEDAGRPGQLRTCSVPPLYTSLCMPDESTVIVYMQPTVSLLNPIQKRKERKKKI